MVILSNWLTTGTFLKLKQLSNKQIDTAFLHILDIRENIIENFENSEILEKIEKNREFLKNLNGWCETCFFNKGGFRKVLKI